MAIRKRRFAPMRRRGVATLSRWVWGRTKRTARHLRRRAPAVAHRVADRLSPWAARRRRKVAWRRWASSVTFRRARLVAFGGLVLALFVMGFVSLILGRPWGPLLSS